MYINEKCVNYSYGYANPLWISYPGIPAVAVLIPWAVSFHPGTLH